MVEEPKPATEEKITEMRETISSLQTDLDKVKVELSELKGAKITEPKAPEAPAAPKEEPQPEEDTKETILAHLKKIPGVGLVMAEKIYDAGYTTRAQLKEVTAEELGKIQGVGPSMATKIIDSLKKLEEGKELAIKAEEAPKPAGPGITDKAMGLIKGTYSKIKGFLVKSPPVKKEGEAAKPPEGKPEESVEVTGAPSDEETQEEPKPEVEGPSAEPGTKEAVLESYEKIAGIDTDLALKLYDAGYGSMDELKEAEVDDLILIEGITPEKAREIFEGLKAV